MELESPAATALVGREAELQAVREALTTIPGTRGVLLEGEAGIGKTALWSAGVAAAEQGGLRVLSARPADAETGLSHATLGDLLGSVVDEVEGIPAPQRHALDVALLRAAPGGAELDPRAVGAATLSVVRAASRREPLLLAIDDIQWIDPASAGALAFALRRLDDEPVLVFATRRGDPGDERVDLGLADERFSRIGVGPLGPEELQRMLHGRLGEGLSWPALARLAEVSGGNPFYALELARAALRHAGPDESVRPELPLPEGVYAVLQDRLRALPSETRDALGTVAAMGHPTLAAATAVVDPGALDAAFTAEVLHEDGEQIRFDHPLLAETAYRMLPPSRRRAVHERLADVATEAEGRARHLAAASAVSDARLAAEIEAGAEAAAARGAPAAAAELLEASARVDPDVERGARRRIEAVHHHVAAGDGRRAVALARAMVDELPAGPLRSRVLVACTQQEGPLDEAHAFASQAVEEAGDDEEALVEALLAEALVLALEHRYEDALECLTRANDSCGPGADRTLRVKAKAAYAKVAHLRGEPQAMDLLREAAELEGDDLIPSAYWGPGMLLGRALMYSDELEAARPLLERRQRQALDAGDDESRSGLCLHLTELEVRAGRFDVALAFAEEGLAIQEASYGELAQGSLAYARALAAAHRGDVRLARESGEQGLAQCEAHGDVAFAAITRATLGFLELSLGDNAAAVERLWPVAERFRSSPALDPGLPQAICIPDAVEALTGLGRLDEAEALLRRWEEAGERLDRPRVRATAARCRALLAAARGELDAALAHAEAALEHHRDLPVPFERARSLIVLGSIQRRVKQKAAARASLDEALASLGAMGARLWADRARAERARIGGRARSGGLTPTEERVAELVAAGRSNKEVAEALFVSVRSVEANLTRVYAKLGIRSRTELASRRER